MFDVPLEHQDQNDLWDFKINQTGFQSDHMKCAEPQKFILKTKLAINPSTYCSQKLGFENSQNKK